MGTRPLRAPEPPRTVLFYSDAPYEGGAERYIDYLVGALPRSWTLGAVVPAEPALDGLADRLSLHGANVWRAPRWTGGALSVLWKAVKDMKPDIVHLNLPHSYSAHYSIAAPVARMAGVHAVISTEHLTMFPPMRARGLLRRALTRSIDRVITLTRSNARDLVDRHRLSAAKVRVVWNGVPEPELPSPAVRDALRRELGAGRGETLLVHVAAFTPRKGHAFLLDALERLGRGRWRLALVGEGEDRPSLERRLSGSAIGSRVRMTGHRTDAGVIVGASDIVVLPSEIEGMPLTLLEAMACGRPAVATTVFGVPEVYEGVEAARLVDFGDVTALARALAELIDDETLRARLGARARALYEARYTAAAMAERTRRVYAEVLEGAAA